MLQACHSHTSATLRFVSTGHRAFPQPLTSSGNVLKTRRLNLFISPRGCYTRTRGKTPRGKAFAGQNCHGRERGYQLRERASAEPLEVYKSLARPFGRYESHARTALARALLQHFDLGRVSQRCRR